MSDKKLTNNEIETLEAQIKSDQEKPVRDNERRVRIGENLESAVKKCQRLHQLVTKTWQSGPRNNEALTDNKLYTSNH